MTANLEVRSPWGCELLRTAAVVAAVGLLASVGPALAATQPARNAQAATAPVITATPTGADLNISPRRVTFGEAERSASVYVFNQGDAPRDLHG